MIDITHKSTTLRTATATAIVKVSLQETVDAVLNKKVPKGDVFEMSKTAGLFGVKKTAELIPDCHPMPIEFTSVQHEVNGLEFKITVTVKAIYRTGVEVEAMHGASIVALTMYDMLKPIDKGIEISSIKLEHKKGGKSDFKDKFRKDIQATVIVCSDTISAGKKEDKAGKAIIEKLKNCAVDTKEYVVIPDEKEKIIEEVNKHCNNSEVRLVILTGGTGLSSRDITPEALEEIIDKPIPGISEAIRKYGQDRTPYSMLSRSVVGSKGDTLIMALPGSTNGASESMDAVFPQVLHVLNILHDASH